MKNALTGAVGLIALVLSVQVAAAQTSYHYTGNNFTSFSCGPSDPGPGTISCSTPAPTNPHTSYTATDHVTATLTLDAPLGPDFPYSDVSGLPGFQLTLDDGQHTVSTPLGSGQGLFSYVSTNASGGIDQWRLGINTGGALNGGVITFDFTDGTGAHVFDWGTLSCCDPMPAGDLAQNFGAPGTWETVTASTTTTTVTIPTTSTTLPATTSTTLEGPFCGDANGDSEVTSADALVALKAAVGIGSCSLEFCDFNGDGKITPLDALAILRDAVGLPSNPTCPAAG